MEEIKALLTNFELLISEERKHANGAAVIREVLDARFAAAGGWHIIKSGGIDWTKCVRHTDRCPRYGYAIDHVERATTQFSGIL